MTLTRPAALAFLLLLSTASRAFSQSENKFALGGEFTVKTSDRASTEDYSLAEFGPGLLWRIGEPKSGWGFHWGLNWYAVKIERPVGAAVTTLGKLHVRPVMAGYGYTYLIHHYAITAAVLGGYAIGSITLDPPAVDAYRATPGVTTASASASNTLVVKPEIGVWFDVSRKVGFNVNAGYMMARPDVTVVTNAGVDFRTARADRFILKAGLVYSIR